MSDLDKAIRAAADEANWFGLRNTLTAVLNELRQWDNEMPVVADRLRRIIAEPLGVSGDRSKPAPAPQQRVWTNERGEQWMDHPHEPDTLVLLSTSSGPTPHVVTRSRVAVETHGGQLTEVTTREENDRG